MNWARVEYPPAEIDPAPAVTPEEFGQRMQALRAAMDRFDYLAIYGDRERFANIRFFTGYEPRFEEALLLIARQGRSLLLVGNEGLGYAESVVGAPDIDLGLCPTLSLYGQPRDLSGRGKGLASWIKLFGLKAGAKIGLIGTKAFAKAEIRRPRFVTDVPVFVANPLTDAVGRRNVQNAADLLVHPATGLRVSGALTEASDVARFEQAAERCYSGVKRLLEELKLGISEEEASGTLGFTGATPLSYHIALGFGPKHVMAGLGSPNRAKCLEPGEPVTFGFGLWGANIARTGFGVANEKGLPREASSYLERLAEPYFWCLKSWYESMKLGVTGGDVYDSVRWFIEDPTMGVGLNPGHLIHLDEWPSTPFSQGSRDQLRSGMFIQCDIIPAPGPPLFGIHTEDGIVLADEKLRKSIEKGYPKVWNRIVRRRELVSKQLGIFLAPEVLPLSSMQACCCPFLLDATNVLCT